MVKSGCRVLPEVAYFSTFDDLGEKKKKTCGTLCKIEAKHFIVLLAFVALLLSTPCGWLVRRVMLQCCSYRSSPTSTAVRKLRMF